MNKRTFIHVLKMVLLFCLCTTLFYVCLRVLQVEYDQYHRYDTPGGPSIKVHRWNNE